MAKNIHPLIQLQGTLSDITFVNSHSYKPHVRAKRGSYKKAEINSSLAQQANRTKLLNAVAKPVHDSLPIYCGQFKERQLWQKILQRLRQAPTNHPATLLQQLIKLDINSKYPAEQLLPAITLTQNKQELLVGLQTSMHPVFDLKQYDSYYYEAVVIFINRQLIPTHRSISTEWIITRDAPPTFELAFTKPAGSVVFLLALAVRAGYNSSTVDVFKGMAMQIVEAGAIS